MNRALNPATNATGIGSAAAAIYAAAAMAWNAAHGHGVIDPQVIVAAAGAVAFLYARFKVTPVADPVDGAGRPLVPAQFSKGGIVPPPGPVILPPATGPHP
jgi:hypothetical protein